MIGQLTSVLMALLSSGPNRSFRELESSKKNREFHESSDASGIRSESKDELIPVKPIHTRASPYRVNGRGLTNGTDVYNGRSLTKGNGFMNGLGFTNGRDDTASHLAYRSYHLGQQTMSNCKEGQVRSGLWIRADLINGLSTNSGSSRKRFSSTYGWKARKRRAMIERMEKRADITIEELGNGSGRIRRSSLSGEKYEWPLIRDGMESEM